MKNWEYKGLYKNYDMKGIINLPNDSKLKVCDLTKELPEFMKESDIIFCDPPCSEGNLKSFFTKADISKDYYFSEFYNILFHNILVVNPNHLFLEVFKSNYDVFLSKCKALYRDVIIYNSYYYNNKKNKCWIFHCSNSKISKNVKYNNIDEEKFIKKLCNEFKYNCIGDLCMGTGLVGKYAFLNNKKFVGIELNKKRLAILVDYIKTRT